MNLSVRSRWGPPRELRATRLGVFYLALTLGMGLAGINTGNNLVMLTCGVMLGLIIASGVLSERCLRDLEVTRELPEHLTVGEEGLVVLVLRNAKPTASFGVLATELDGSGLAHFPLVAGGASAKRAYQLTPRDRGTLRLNRLRLSTAYPFGIFEKSLVVERPEALLIAPAALEAPLPSSASAPGLGDQAETSEGLGPDPRELRLHRDGEDVRRIAWAQSARAGQLLALTRDEEGTSQAQLILRPQPTAQALERHLRELRYQAETLLRRGASVSLRAGDLGELELLSPGTGEAQRRRLLNLLAREAAPAVARADGLEAPWTSAPEGPRSVPRLLRWQRAFLFSLVGVAVASVAVSGELPWQALVTFGLLAAYAIPTRERASEGFAQTVNGLSVVGLAALLGAAFTRTASFQVAAAEGALLLCANRLLVRRTPEDDGLLHLTTFLLLAAGAALGGDLVYGLLLVAFSLLAPPSLTLGELRRGIEEQAAARATALMAAPELTAPRLLASSAALGGAALLFGAVIFPLFPRVQVGLMKAFASGGARLSGVSDHVDLSAGGELRRDSRLVLRVGLDSGDPEVLHYFRAVTLDRFSGTGWTRTPDQEGRPHASAAPSRTTVSGELEPFVKDGDFVPVPEGLTDLSPEVFGLSLRPDDQGDLKLLSAPKGALVLRFRAGPRRRPDSRAPPDEAVSPADLPRALVDAAFQVIPEGTAPADAARRVERYLSAFHYDSDVPGGERPLDLLFETRKGDCQLFASAAVLMLRLRGIPARYVAGYYLASPHRGENLVRAWDAHAWAEALTPEGPLLVDGTPPIERGGHREHTSAWQAVVDAWQAAQFRWLRSVVDYDLTTQVRQAEWLIAFGRQLSKAGATHGLPLGKLAWLTFGAWLLWLSWHRIAARGDPARQLEQRLFGRLGALGVKREPATTYEDALAQLEAHDPALAQRAAPLLRRLGQARFGARPLEEW